MQYIYIYHRLKMCLKLTWLMWLNNSHLPVFSWVIVTDLWGCDQYSPRVQLLSNVFAAMNHFITIVLIGAFISFFPNELKASQGWTLFEACCQWALLNVQIITLLFPLTVQKYMYPPVSKVHAGSFHVSVIHRTLTWTTWFLTCIHNQYCVCVKNTQCILNDGSVTYIHPATGSPSALDLPVCNPSINNYLWIVWHFDQTQNGQWHH